MSKQATETAVAVMMSIVSTECPCTAPDPSSLIMTTSLRYEGCGAV
jgi:hypothetical protein